VNENQSVLPDVQTAYNNLFTAVHQQVFFNKCAAAGYCPRSPEEAQWMLETAGKLRLVEHDAVVKQAQDAGSTAVNPYFVANRMLDHVVSSHGLDGSIKQAQAANEEMAKWQAAVDLCRNPILYNSVLALKAAEAAEIQAQLEASR
jgi:hypothetical protein